ncbi:hypothetical protein VTH82DRAFT_2834 [Thermothelomyces myriococcoides]
MAASSSLPESDAPASTGPDQDDLVLTLCKSSRKLVREWGLLRPTSAPFSLSPAAVHCLIEIGEHRERSVSDLCDELGVTPAQLSPVLSELASNGVIQRDQGEQAGPKDREIYAVSEAGSSTLSEINAYAQEQVTKALAAAKPGPYTSIAAAVQAYTTALERSRSGRADVAPTPPEVSIVAGYRPGVLGRTLEMHINYYHQRFCLGRTFEAGLAESFSDLLNRLDRPVNQVWSAVMKTTPAQGPAAAAPPRERIVGVVYIDGECSKQEGVARLRCFIVDESVQGLGIGKRLLAAAMQFVRDTGFRECHLSTLRPLTVARHLYEREGFKQAGEFWFEEFEKGEWGVRYVWRRPEQS